MYAYTSRVACAVEDVIHNKPLKTGSFRKSCRDFFWPVFLTRAVVQCPYLCVHISVANCNKVANKSPF